MDAGVSKVSTIYLIILYFTILYSCHGCSYTVVTIPNVPTDWKMDVIGEFCS